MEHLKPLNQPLDIAVMQYAEAVNLLDGGPLLEAVRFFSAHQGQNTERKYVEEVAEEVIADREHHQASKLHLRNLCVRLHRFTKAFHCFLASLTTKDLERLLDSLKDSLRTRKNFVTTIGTLFTSTGQGTGGMSQQEVAALKNISERAVRETERRAFEKLRNHPKLREFWAMQKATRRFWATFAEPNFGNVSGLPVNVDPTVLRTERPTRRYVLFAPPLRLAGTAGGAR